MSVRSFSKVPTEAQLPAVALAMQAVRAAANSIANAVAYAVAKSAAARRARATSALCPEMPETL